MNLDTRNVGRSVLWLRRDLRLKDHRPLSLAHEFSKEVVAVFIFDRQILDALPDRSDRRVNFIYQSLRELDLSLREKKSRLVILHGNPKLEIPAFANRIRAERVVCGEDYEPYAKIRDAKIKEKLDELSIEFVSIKDQVILAGNEVLKDDGSPYRVFTPYWKAWSKTVSKKSYQEAKPSKINWIKAQELSEESDFPTLDSIGFKQSSLWLEPGSSGAQQKLRNFKENLSQYKQNRDFPNLHQGTSHLSVHLRFGTISIRELVRSAKSYRNEGALTWLKELVWREFYQMILDQFPHVVDSNFKPDTDSIEWPGIEEHFEKWKEGQTGYPIVDAAMRHFKETGWMHNRLRMIVASFLTKDLLIDWRAGEKYFEDYLLDFDLASNNGGWQWSASTGVDAQPYFRIFNPTSQSERFDPDGEYIRSHVPELESLNSKQIHAPENVPPMELSSLGVTLGKTYPHPIVDHKVQRERAIALFKK